MSSQSIEKAIKVKAPPSAESFENTQIDLFQQFLCNTQEQRKSLSNTIDFWDHVPKYCYSQVAQNKLRTKEGFLPKAHKSFMCFGKKYELAIAPELMIDERGNNKAFYPSANEGLVEDALRKIAAQQQHGFYANQNDGSAGVVFTLYQLREELKKTGHSRSYQELVKSLLILAGSNLEIIPEDKSGIIKSNYISSLAMVTRAKLKEDPNSKWIVEFHPLVRESMRSITYRQFNYQQMMSFKSHLARWMYKKLAHYYTNASLTTPFVMSFENIRRESGMLDRERTNNAIQELEAVFEELKEKSVFMSVTRNRPKGSKKKITDILYSATPHPEFIKCIKASNKRQSDLRTLQIEKAEIVGRYNQQHR